MEAKGKATLSYDDGKTLELPVYGGTIGPDVIDIRALYGKTGKFTYDPGFLSTASCSSKITYIDGDAGVLLPTAATRSTSSRPSRASSRWRTC